MEHLPVGPDHGNHGNLTRLGRLGHHHGDAPSGAVVALSRATLREVRPGSTVSCTACGEVLRSGVRRSLRQVICNVYEAGKWVGIAHFHDDCYRDAGEPYGTAQILPAAGRQRRPHLRETG